MEKLISDVSYFKGIFKEEQDIHILQFNTNSSKPDLYLFCIYIKDRVVGHISARREPDLSAHLCNPYLQVDEFIIFDEDIEFDNLRNIYIQSIKCLKNIAQKCKCNYILFSHNEDEEEQKILNELGFFEDSVIFKSDLDNTNEISKEDALKSAHGLTIEQVTLENLEVLIPLYKELMGEEVDTKRFKECFIKESQDSTYSIYVLRKGNAPVGSFRVRGENLFFGTAMQLENVIIYPEYRSQGYGKVIMDYTRALAYENKYKHLILVSGLNRKEGGAYKFYERNDYYCNAIGYKKKLVH